jgi:signal transduction histidine kinase
MTLRAPSFRTRILLIVLTVSVIPLALTGLWLTRSAERSGEDLLLRRLEQTLSQTVSQIGNNWLRLRSDLLFLGEDETVQRALVAVGTEGVPGDPPEEVRRLFEALDPSVVRVGIHGLERGELWTLTVIDSERERLQPTLRQSLAIHQRFPARELGSLQVDLELDGLLGAAAGAPSVAGQVLGAVETSTGAQLLPLPFDPALLETRRFSWGGDEWLTARRRMSDPALTLVAAAPLSGFAGPFQEAARRGTMWLAVVATAGVLITYMLTRRMTRSLERLAASAEAVSRGDLENRIEDPGRDEVGRVARAFNTMTESLRETLRELARRERFAAVGEFAASLAHEVRNPLTAIRIDLQRVEEWLPVDSPLREAQARALTEIGRLDATVSETLDVARTGRWRAGSVDLKAPLRAAAEAAAPAFAERDADLDASALAGAPIEVRGDEKALQQLFLNLMLNAAGALEAGGRAWIAIAVDGGHAVVSVHDTGVGIAPDTLDRVFDPLFTTRAEGTGLGLTVVKRIVDDHDGRIEIDSEIGVGTTVRVRLPR